MLEQVTRLDVNDFRNVPFSAEENKKTNTSQ